LNITSILPDVSLLFLIALISVYKFIGLNHAKLLLFTFSTGLIISFALLLQQFTFNGHFNFLGSLSIDPYGTFLKLLTLFSFAVIYFLIDFDHSKINFNSIIYYSTLLFSVFILISSSNLLLTFISFEIISLVYFGITCTGPPKNNVSFYRSWIISSSLMLFGITLFYGMFGSLQYSRISSYLSVYPVNKLTLTIAILMIFCGFSFKIYVFPLQSVMSNISDRISIGKSGIILLTSSLAGIASLTRLIYTAFNDAGSFNTSVIIHSLNPVFNWELFLTIIYCLSVLTSAFVLYLQKEIIKIFLYIFLINLPLTLISCSFNTYTNLSVNILLIIQTVLPYLVLLIINSHFNEKLSIRELSDLKGIYKTSPVLSIILIISLLSLSGFPLTIGFISRLYIFSAVSTGYSLIIIASSIISSMIILYTVYKMLRLMFSSGTNPVIGRINWVMLSVLMILSAFPAVIGIYSDPLIYYLNFISYINYYL